jgi:hypothetical protein
VPGNLSRDELDRYVQRVQQTLDTLHEEAEAVLRGGAAALPLARAA